MTRSGVVFCTYSLLIQGGGRVADLGKDGIDLNALLMKPGSRLEQLVSWLSEDKHGPLVVFDECHRAKNLVNENGTFLCISVWAISMTPCFVYRRLWHVCADAARRAVAWDIEHEGLVDQKIHAFAIFQMEKHWGELEEDGRALFLPSGIKGREMRYEFTCVVTDSPGEDQVRLL